LTSVSQTFTLAICIYFAWLQKDVGEDAPSNQGVTLEYPFSGDVVVHAVARARAKQVEWLLATVLGYQVPLQWQLQSQVPHALKTAFSWQGDENFGPELASALAGWKEIYFEVIQFPNEHSGGSIWLYTPDLGIKHRAIDAIGNYLIGENELRAAMTKSSNAAGLSWEIENLLATEWDQFLDPPECSFGN
jgi:hypothetical protein